MLRQYQEAYRETQRDIEAQSLEQTERLQSEAESQRAKLALQVLEAKTEVRGGVSEVELQHQELAQQLREAERLEERRGVIEAYEPVDLQTEARIKELETTAASIFAEARQSTEAIEKQETEALAKLDKALEDALTEVREAKDKALQQAWQQYDIQSREFERANIELGDGEWVDKEKWDDYFKDMPLDIKEELQSIAKLKGLDAMNKAIKELPTPTEPTEPTYIYTEIPPPNSVKLMTDEYVNKDEFDALPLIDQNTLRIQGVDAYNKMISERATVGLVETPEGIEEVTTTIEVVELDTPTGKKQMPKAEWDALTEMEQVEVSLGRPPTLSEWQSYRIDTELVKPRVMMQYDVDSYFRTMGVGVALGEVSRLFPGVQKYEAINNVMGSAEGEWQKAYPDMYEKGVGITALEWWFPPARAFYPEIEAKDIKAVEWE